MLAPILNYGNLLLSTSNKSSHGIISLVEFVSFFSFGINYIVDASPFIDIFKKQITHLIIPISDIESSLSPISLSINFYARIFSLFVNLINLDFGPISTRRRYPKLTINDVSLKICFSSSIVNLRIGVETFDDCLYLLDGRLNQLRTFTVRVDNIRASSMIINTMVRNFLHLNKRMLFFFKRFYERF